MNRTPWPAVAFATILLFLMIGLAAVCHDPQGVGRINEGKLDDWWFPWYYFAVVPQEEFASAHQRFKRLATERPPLRRNPREHYIDVDPSQPKFYQFDRHAGVQIRGTYRAYRMMNYIHDANVVEFDN